MHNNLSMRVLFILAIGILLTTILIPVSAKNYNADVFILQSDSTNQKIVKLQYVDDIDKLSPISNKMIFINYYNEESLKDTTIDSITDQNGVVTFNIPSTLENGSFVFRFSLLKDDLIKRRAFRIVPLSEYNKGGQKSILFIFDDNFATNKEAHLQLMQFPKNGDKLTGGGDILLEDSVFRY